ncbi:class II glutamine amidotransferase [Planctomicrobium sp. SH661]|uniref:class II glutamine amidotransferase n=1 Tax=Planctomicrobium sp. SH661 TaxID=3448124 RepID=UPI003F5C404A
MCRWMAYSGSPILMEELLFKPQHSLIDQSMASHSRETPTNGDGFGIGWYGYQGRAGLYRSIRPAWNDFNLRDLASQIETPLFLAHVRATSQATVQETNCHPFRYRNWLFVHNGEIFEIEKIRRDLLLGIAPELFSNILGTTDSEIMFYLAVTFGLESDPLGALARMAGFIEETAQAHGIPESLWMTVAVSNGQTLYGVRYASDGDAPSLYHSRDMDDIFTINPYLKQVLGHSTRVLVSEPIGAFQQMWEPISQSTAVRCRAGNLDIFPFKPVKLAASAA